MAGEVLVESPPRVVHGRRSSVSISAWAPARVRSESVSLPDGSPRAGDSSRVRVVRQRRRVESWENLPHRTTTRPADSFRPEETAAAPAVHRRDLRGGDLRRTLRRRKESKLVMAAHVAEAPVTVEATATAVPVQHASKVDDTGVAGRAEVVSAVAPTECRRCGKIFTPGANASPGSAQYYRECPETTPRRRQPCAAREPRRT